VTVMPRDHVLRFLKPLWKRIEPNGPFSYEKAYARFGIDPEDPDARMELHDRLVEWVILHAPPKRQRGRPKGKTAKQHSIEFLGDLLRKTFPDMPYTQIAKAISTHPFPSKDGKRRRLSEDAVRRRLYRRPETKNRKR
jgi:hypothetical protein